MAASCQGGMNLRTAVLLPTPTVQDACGRDRHNQKNGGVILSLLGIARLTSEGLLTTPCADDTGYRQNRYNQGGTALSTQVGGQLNPRWVEWLMAYQDGWTECAPWATPSSPRARGKRSRD